MASDDGETLCQEVLQVRPERFVLDPFQQGIEKSVHDEAASGVALDAAGLHVEEFVLAYGAVGGSVAAADFVVQDFELRMRFLTFW